MPSRYSSLTFKTLSPPIFYQQLPLNLINPRPYLSLNSQTLAARIRCAANSGSPTGNWDKWLPRNVIVADKVLRLISGATSSPIGQFISSPITFLHSIDPRIKLDQLGRVSLLFGILFIMLGLSTDGAPPLVQPRSPPPSMMGLPNLSVSLEGYSYFIMKLGPLQLMRKGLSAASTAACLTFTVRNVALGIVSRRVNWQQFATMETVDIFLAYICRIFKNIFSHAEQISQGAGEGHSYRLRWSPSG